MRIAPTTPAHRLARSPMLPCGRPPLPDLTDLLANRSAAFLETAWKADPAANVLAMVGTPAAHNPCDPAPPFARDYDNATGRAPRTQNWNVGRAGKHWPTASWARARSPSPTSRTAAG